MSFHLPGPNGELAQLEFLLKAWPEQKLTRGVFTFSSLVEYFSMWHKSLTVREVTLWSQGCLFEYTEQLVKLSKKAELSHLPSPFKCS